jgi:5-methyltetrahydrofolate--homocysteine methyltransferase
MERQKVSLPLLIGGATTSAKHTAVKIAPCYHQTTVHVLDASRCVGIVEQLLNPKLRTQFDEQNRAAQAQLVRSYEDRKQIKLVSYREARTQGFRTDWTSIVLPKPAFLGRRVLDDVPLSELVPYIDWSPFFMAWELKGKHPAILDDPNVGPEARRLFCDAQRLLDEIVSKGLLRARGVYGFWPANACGDDVAISDPSTEEVEVWDGEADTALDFVTVHFLRQQWERVGQRCYFSLADFIAPAGIGRRDYLGMFAVTTGHGVQELVNRFEREHDDYQAIMVKALADRLAEAFAERLHQRARADWGYGRDEQLTHDQLIAERYRGMRPAPGYPACPDHTEKRVIFDLLDAEVGAGITLTENFAMLPAASVSGYYFAHPNARYFSVDRIGRDQVEDYALRKGMTVPEIERWLAPNLGYEPR